MTQPNNYFKVFKKHWVKDHFITLHLSSNKSKLSKMNKSSIIHSSKLKAMHILRCLGIYIQMFRNFYAQQISHVSEHGICFQAFIALMSNHLGWNSFANLDFFSSCIWNSWILDRIVLWIWDLFFHEFGIVEFWMK